LALNGRSTARANRKRTYRITERLPERRTFD
jgi:hypothetical protein